MRKFSFIYIAILFSGIALLALFFVRAQARAPLIPTSVGTATSITPHPIDNTNNNLPTAIPDPAPTPSRVIDLAPAVPDRDKAYLWIQHPDGSQDEVRLSQDMIADYVQQLPPGDRLISDAPPLSLLEVHPPDPSAGPIIETNPPGTPSPNPPTVDQ